MADSQSKIDAAAEKAFADAAEKKTADSAKQPVDAKAVEKVKADAVAKAVAAEPAPKAKASAGKTKPKKALAKKKKAAPKTAAAKTTPASSTKGAPAKATPAKRSSISQLKDTIMATANKTTNIEYTAKAKEMAADMQTRAKAAYEKGTEMTKDAVEFQKGNIEALVESGKILAAGMQDMGRTYMDEAKSAAETVQGDVKKFAAIKSPTELFQLQGEIARRNFDAMVSTTSKNTEAMLKLANEAFAPVSNRMSLAVDKVSKAA